MIFFNWWASLGDGWWFQAPAVHQPNLAGDLQGVSYPDFAERTQKHGQRRVFEAGGP